MLEEIGSHSVLTSLHNLFIPNNLPLTDLKYYKVDKHDMEATVQASDGS